MKQFKTISSFFLKVFGKKRLVKLLKLLSLSIKSLNPIEKYPQLVQSFVCILKVFVKIVDLSINFMTSFGICSTPKLSKQVTQLSKAIQ